jgi:hypothetical protein
VRDFGQALRQFLFHFLPSVLQQRAGQGAAIKVDGGGQVAGATIAARRADAMNRRFQVVA